MTEEDVVSSPSLSDWPVFLMASSAVGLVIGVSWISEENEGYYRHHHHLVTTAIVALLWSAVTISGSTREYHLAVHLVMVQAFWGTLWLSSSSRRPLFVSERVPLSGRLQPKWIPSLLRSTLLGTWVVLTGETLFPTSSRHSLFILSGCLLALLSFWYQQQHIPKKKPQSSSCGRQDGILPSSNDGSSRMAPPPSSLASPPSLSAAYWYQWNTADTVSWITHTFRPPEHLYVHQDMTTAVLVDAIQAQQLTCRQLMVLSISDLQQITTSSVDSLPLGVVFRLGEHLQALQDAHPCPPEYALRVPWKGNDSSLVQSTGPIGGGGSWLDQYDKEYARGFSIPPVPPAQLSTQSTAVELPAVGTSPLPQPTRTRTHKANDDKQSSTAGLPRAAAAVASSFSTTTALPEDFMAGLPPHIAAIALQKPDLVRQVLASHHRANNNKRSVDYASEDVINFKDEALIEEEDEEEEDDERTELLRQRRKQSPPQPSSSHPLSHVYHATL